MHGFKDPDIHEIEPSTASEGISAAGKKSVHARVTQASEMHHCTPLHLPKG